MFPALTAKKSRGRPNCRHGSQERQSGWLRSATRNPADSSTRMCHLAWSGLDVWVMTGAPVILDASLRSDGDYGVTVGSRNIPGALRMWGVKATFWGVPADPSHDAQRCDVGGFGMPEVCSSPTPAGLPPTAFLRMPTRCTQPGEGLETSVSADTWENPGSFVPGAFTSHLPPNFPDYSPYCPYTAGSTNRGTWTAPDLTKAKTLVARSGTRGMKVTLWAWSQAKGFNKVAEKVLHSLGYRVAVKPVVGAPGEVMIVFAIATRTPP